MTLKLIIHPENPQARLLKQAVDILAKGGIAAVPTDSSYALVCHLEDRSAVDKIRQIRKVDEKHHLTLICKDLSELSHYAKVDNRQFRLLKSATPGPYTFILEATKEVPRRVCHPQRKSIGLRVPNHAVLLDLLGLHGAPLLSTTLIAPGDTQAINDPDLIASRFNKAVDIIIDAGACHLDPTTVVDLTSMNNGDPPTLIRAGRGDLASLGL